jgi:hypothetical protein
MHRIALAGTCVERTYARPGAYSEVLKVTTGTGAIAYDFAIVHVLDKANPEKVPPAVHAAYSPTLNIKAGDEVTFKVRTFRGGSAGDETWDFGDGSPPVTVQSDGNATKLAKNGYAVTTHRYSKPGLYLVRVVGTEKDGGKTMAHLAVEVGPRE